jgi:hypothetical protein
MGKGVGNQIPRKGQRSIFFKKSPKILEIKNKSLSLHPLLELTPVSRVFFGSFQEAFFGLLTYTLQFKTSKYKRLAPCRRCLVFRPFPRRSWRSSEGTRSIHPGRQFPGFFLGGVFFGRVIRDTRDRVPGATVPAGSTALGSRWLFIWRSRGFSMPFAIYPIPVVRHPGARLDDGGIQGY